MFHHHPTSSYPHYMFLSFLFIQTYIEEPPPAAIVFHPPPQPAVPPVLHHLYLIVVSWCGVWFAPLPSGDVCSKRTSANLIVAIPLLIAIGREGRSNHTISRAGRVATTTLICIVDDAVIGNREGTFVRRDEGKHIHVAAVDLRCTYIRRPFGRLTLDLPAIDLHHIHHRKQGYPRCPH